MDWLEFVRGIISAVAWPIVVLVLLLKFRSEVERLVRRLTRLNLAGQEAQFADRDSDREAERLTEEAIRRNAEVLGVAHSGSTETAEPSPINDAAEREAPEPVAEDRRAALQDIVTSAADWGAQRARAGLTVQGARLIWDDEGRPDLQVPPRPPGAVEQVAAVVDDDWLHVGRQDQAARRLEAKISQLERELAEVRFTGGNMLATMPIQQQIDQERRRLQRLDPVSPYLM